jgi:large subunit ribosomal protein L25
MSDTVTLKASKRDLQGTKPNALRAEGNTPAVIHDHGKPSHHILVEQSDLVRVYHSAGKHHTVEIDLEGKKFTTLIKEVTYKPASNIVFHSVFQAVKANEKVSAEVPLKLTEEIPAEKASLLVVTGIDSVEVEAMPKDLVDSIEVDGSMLVEAGDKITVADLKVPSGIVIKTDSEQLVAVVEVPKDQVAEADAAAAELADSDAGKPADDEAEEEAEAKSEN